MKQTMKRSVFHWKQSIRIICTKCSLLRVWHGICLSLLENTKSVCRYFAYSSFVALVNPIGCSVFNLCRVRPEIQFTPAFDTNHEVTVDISESLRLTSRPIEMRSGFRPTSFKQPLVNSYDCQSRSHHIVVNVHSRPYPQSVYNFA